MKILISFFSVAFLLLMGGCILTSSEDMLFTLQNHTDEAIYNVSVHTSEDSCQTTNFAQSIPANTEKTLILTLPDAKEKPCASPQKDGHYILYYTRDAEDKEESFGYYSNGAFAEDGHITIEVKNDGIQVTYDW